MTVPALAIWNHPAVNAGRLSLPVTDAFPQGQGFNPGVLTRH